MSFFRRLRRAMMVMRGEMGMRDATRKTSRSIDELDAHLEQAHSELAEAIAQERHVLMLAEQESHAAGKLLMKARRALQIDREDLARNALAMHVRAVRHAAQLRRLAAQYHQATERLRKLLDTYDLQRTELLFRQQLLEARGRLAQSRRELMHCLRSERAHGKWENAEDEVLRLEDSTDALEQLTQSGSYVVEIQQDSLSDDERVNNMIQDMRGRESSNKPLT